MYNNSLDSLYNQIGGSFGFVNFIKKYILLLIIGCIITCSTDIIIDYYQTGSTVTINKKIDDIDTISKEDFKKITLSKIVYLNILPSIIKLCIWTGILFFMTR